MNMYWYKQGTQRHVIFASTRNISNWYVKSKSSMRGCVFIEMNNRAATPTESHTVLAHNADKTLQEALESWRVNGGSAEYMATLNRLAKGIKILTIS